MPYSPEHPWIAERETIMDAWKIDYNRGYINNMNVNLAADWYSMSEKAMRGYARMLKSFGYTGMQMTDNCSHWRWFNSPDPDHDRKITMARILREEGMKASLWVWAADFNGHGWNDPSVVYKAKDGGSAYDDPEVFACFDRYYDIYAELAPYFDRLIMHFFDPGHLDNYEDIFRFARLLESKFKAVNPALEICVDTWGCPDDFPEKLVAAGFKDYMLMELPFLPTWGKPGRRAAFRRKVRDLGCKLGVWSWYTCDIEVDQNARWVVNPKVIKYIYDHVREQGDDVMIPSYWSEMDSYHVLNLFSLYCAGQMLINPDRDTDELLYEIAHKIYGDKYGDKVYDILRFVEAARSGDRWETFWWDTPWDPGVKVNAREMLPIAEQCLKDIRGIAADRTLTTDQPLPVTPAELANLMAAHIDQLARYFRFTVDMEELTRKADAGVSKDVLYAELDRIWKPIPDFNAVIGVWGQPECRAQLAAVWRFCDKTGVPMPKRGLLFYTIKKRYYEYLVSECRAYGVTEVDSWFYEGSAPYGFIEKEIFDALEAEGLIRRVGEKKDKIRLVDADAYQYL